MQLIPQDQRLHHMDMHDKNPVSFIDPTVMVDQYHTEESLLTNQRAFEKPRSIDRLSFVHHKMVNNMNRSRQKYIITIC